jgi:putative membrane protein
MMGRISLALGVAVLAAAWLGPLPALTEQYFVAHMTMHVAVVAVASPLLALGLAGTRADPARAAPALFAPVPASVLELVVVWAWHAPALHHASRHADWALALEQAMFLAVGLLVWLSALGGPRHGGRAAAGIAALLLTSMHMTLLGALLALSPRPLYGHAADAAHAMAALDDQHLGGVLMLLVGGVAYLIGGLYLLSGLLRERADAPAPAEPPGSGR